MIIILLIQCFGNLVFDQFVFLRCDWLDCAFSVAYQSALSGLHDLQIMCFHRQLCFLFEGVFSLFLVFIVRSLNRDNQQGMCKVYEIYKSHKPYT